MPDWMDPFFLEVLFAVAGSYDEHDNATFSARLADIVSGPQLRILKVRDGGSQPYVGEMRGGAMQREMLIDGPVGIGIATRVLGPS